MCNLQSRCLSGVSSGYQPPSMIWQRQPVSGVMVPCKQSPSQPACIRCCRLYHIAWRCLVSYPVTSHCILFHSIASIPHLSRPLSYRHTSHHLMETHRVLHFFTLHQTVLCPVLCYVGLSMYPLILRGDALNRES